jgi:hypothetical protein
LHCRFLILLFLLTAALFPTPGLAAQQSPQTMQQPLLVLLVPGLTLEDLLNQNALNKLLEESAVGLMNSSGEGSRKPAAAYLSLSSGVKAACPEREGGLFFQQSETLNDGKAGEIYASWLGNEAEEYEIVMPYFKSILDANVNKGKPGLLADTLKRQGVSFLFMGNQDLPGTTYRPGALAATDSTGRIKEGCVDARARVVNSSSPTHYTTNYSFFYEKTAEFLKNRPGIVFLDLGDLARLDAIFDYLPTEVYNHSRLLLLTQISAFLERIMELAKETRTSVLLVTPFPGKSTLLLGSVLTPVIYHLPGGSASLLTSASTKRLGMLTNLDIAPTILFQAGIRTYQGFAGRPLQVVPHPAPLKLLISTEEKTITNHRQRPLFLKGYVLLQIAVVILVAVFILLRHPLLYRTGPFLLVLTGGPLFFLLLPVAGLFARMAVLFLYGGLTVIVLKRFMAIKRLAFLYLLTALVITTDILLGAPLMKSSLLGYDPISGARYYGLGNEYMGVLLGSSLIGLTLLMETLNREYSLYSRFYLPGILFVFGVLTILVAAPQGGTNVGGAIAFTASLALLPAAVYSRRLNLKMLIAVGLSCFATVLILFYTDLHRPVEVQSHIGLTARLIREEGLSSLLPVVIRKVNMNIKLIQYSLWTRVFLTLLGASALIFYRPPGLIKKIFSAFPCLKAGFNAGLCGSFIALLVNDSGIVAAATCSIFVVLTLLYLIAERVADKTG